MKVVDIYCDTIAETYRDYEREGRQSVLENRLTLDLRKMQVGDYGLQNPALYVSLEQTKGGPFEFCMELLNTFYQETEAHEDIIGIVRAYDDIRESWEQDRMPALLTAEEDGTRQGKTASPRDLYRLGAHMMTLIQNFPSELAFPNARVEDADGTFRMASDTEHGLTDTGAAFVEEMGCLGMVIDISHLNGAGIRNVFRYTSKPFVTSHSNTRATAFHPRNLTGDMTRALAERGNVMGINYCTAFLWGFGPREEQLGRVSDMVEYMKHTRKIGDIGYIGSVFDSDGINGSLEVGDAEKLPMLANVMERKGFTASEIEAVFYKNVLRMYKDIL